MCVRAAKLDRDVHVAAQIAAEIDDAHATATELADDVVTVSNEPFGGKHPRERYHGPVSDAIERLIDRYGSDRICAALAPMLTAERIARIDAVLAARLASVVAAVEDTYDPHNAAATIRTSEALGLQELHIIEPGERFAAAKGVTRGAHRWIDLVRWSDAESAVRALHARGFRVYATAPDAHVSVEDCDVATPLAVMFGNEHDGLSAGAIAAADATLAVPMFGFSESYNLSVTVGLAMSRLAARRRAYISAPGDLDPDRRARLRARWFALRIRGAVGVVERALDRPPG
jgi:tRNA (guanosine-2'-O-)-methyltransferase